MTENLPATVTDEYGTGLEDLDPNEVQIPRIKVDHPNAVFKDGITGEEFPEIYGVLLGMVKQRIKWHPALEQREAKPQCKSNDGVMGYPNMEGPDSDDKFPWLESGMTPGDMPRDTDGRVTIPCATCPFQKWGGTKLKPKPPPCSELHTFPIMYSIEENGAIDRAGIVTFKGSGIKPSKAYMTGFVRNKRPLYSAYTKIKLGLNTRGMVTFSTPEFSKTGEVAVEDWPQYGEELKGLREFLRQPPRSSSDEAPAAGSAGTLPMPSVAPVATSAPTVPAASRPAAAAPSSVIDAVATPASAAPPVATPDDDDLPF